MKFTGSRTILAFGLLLAIVLTGTAMSPMSMSTVMMVAGGLFVFGLLTLLIGIKHGEYRASR